MKKFIPFNYEELTLEEMLKNSEAFKALMEKRRTVRMFSDKPVSMELIKNCVAAASLAPSGANKQPWHFVIVGNTEIKREIRIAAEEEEKRFYSGRAPQSWLKDLEMFGTNERKEFLETAPFLIVVFEEKYKIANDKIIKNYYTKESVGIATGILITALHYSNLVTLTHTPSPMNFLNKILNRPPNEKPFLIVVTGYPAQNALVPNIGKKDFNEVATILT